MLLAFKSSKPEFEMGEQNLGFLHSSQQKQKYLPDSEHTPHIRPWHLTSMPFVICYKREKEDKEKNFKHYVLLLPIDTYTHIHTHTLFYLQQGLSQIISLKSLYIDIEKHIFISKWWRSTFKPVAKLSSK